MTSDALVFTHTLMRHLDSDAETQVLQRALMVRLAREAAYSVDLDFVDNLDAPVSRETLAAAVAGDLRAVWCKLGLNRVLSTDFEAHCTDIIVGAVYERHVTHMEFKLIKA